MKCRDCERKEGRKVREARTYDDDEAQSKIPIFYSFRR